MTVTGVRHGRLGVLAVLLAVTLILGAPGSRSFATSPCGPIQYDPNPPGGPPEPTISGTIRNAYSTNGIAGVTVMLYQCSTGSGVYQSSTSTNLQGAYSFGGLDDEHWYYVEAPLSGPLSGMSPASGTSNPTAAIGLGDSVSGVNLGFQ